MRDSSYQSSKQHQQMFSRGGEKKVMKKSLSLLLSIALIFGAFASAASAAESDLTTQQKYDALAAKGIFAGINGEAALDQKMTRAQFARILSLLLGLEGIGNPDTKVVTEKPFPDVAVDAWYAEEVAAAKEAGAMVGNADGTFNPQGNVTVQELAVAIAQTLKLEPVEGATVEGAADWAAGYIQALLDAGITVPTNYTEAATRGQLVDATYAADMKLNPVEPEKVSVVDAKATGVQKVTVTLDKAVDTSKATFTLKKGTAAITIGDPVWSEDKKTATLPLTNVKISEGTYTVTLGGLESDEIGTASVEFVAENETVTKLEFVTASDNIAKSTKAKIKVRPENQYGEIASFNASSYTVSAMSLPQTLTKDSEGYLIITLDTSDANLLTGVSVVPVYIYFDDNRVTAQKTFTVGTTPFVSKLELGELKYNNGGKALTKEGESATVAVKLFDQYGNPITPSQVTADAADTPPINISVNFNTVFSPYNPALQAASAVNTADDVYEVTVSVKMGEKIEKAATHNLTIYAGSASGTTSVAVDSARVAMNVKVGDIDGVLAQGDTDVYIPLIVTDVNGNELTAQEIADNFSRITISGSGLGTLTKVTVGANKGKVKASQVNATAGSYAFLSASIISQNANSYDYKQFKVEDPRVPESVAVKTKPAAKAVLGANSDFDLIVRDQYGKELDYTGNGYYVKVELTNTSVTTDVYSDVAAVGNVVNGDIFGTGFAGVAGSIADFNDGFYFDTKAGEVGKSNLVAYLYKAETAGTINATNDDVVSSTTVSIESISNTTPLFYSLNSVGDMYAAIDSGLLKGDNDDALDGDQFDPTVSEVAKELKLTVKDAAGNTVAYPDSFQSVSIENGNYLKGAVSGNKAYIIGHKAGTTSVTAIVATANGGSQSLTTTVTTKSDVVTVSKITVDNSEKDIDAATSITDIGGANLMGLNVFDQYGNEYNDGDVYDYDKLLGIRYVVSDIVGTGTVTVTDNGATGFDITVPATVTEFVLTAISRDGKVSASTVVYR